MNTLEVFSHRQLSDKHLKGIHDALLKNPLTFMDATEEKPQFA